MTDNEKIEKLEDINKRMGQEIEKIKNNQWAWETSLYLFGFRIAKTIRKRILLEE